MSGWFRDTGAGARRPAKHSTPGPFRADLDVSDTERAAGKLQSYYMVLTRELAAVAGLAGNPNWSASRGV